jgi:hypothetical protein
MSDDQSLLSRRIGLKRTTYRGPLRFSPSRAVCLRTSIWPGRPMINSVKPIAVLEVLTRRKGR